MDKFYPLTFVFFMCMCFSGNKSRSSVVPGAGISSTQPKNAVASTKRTLTSIWTIKALETRSKQRHVNILNMITKNVIFSFAPNLPRQFSVGYLFLQPARAPEGLRWRCRFVATPPNGPPFDCDSNKYKSSNIL